MIIFIRLLMTLDIEPLTNTCSILGQVMHLGRKQYKVPDLSLSLWDAETWTPRSIKRLGINGGITCNAVEPLSGILALGTDRGSVHLFGAPSVSTELAVSGAPYRKIRFIAFAQSCAKMLVIGIYASSMITRKLSHCFRFKA